MREHGGSERDRLLELHEAHVRAWNDRDLDALAELYDPDCVVFDTYPPPVFHGWEEFRRRIEPKLLGDFDATIETHDRVVRVDERQDDRIGWIASRYRIDGVEGGEPFRTTGRWTEIYEKQGAGEWKLVHLHSSVDPVER